MKDGNHMEQRGPVSYKSEIVWFFFFFKFAKYNHEVPQNDIFYQIYLKYYF